MIESRAVVHAERHAIAAGHELATRAGMEVLEAGGNAVDAGGCGPRARCPAL